jgi:hypothetical protein
MNEQPRAPKVVKLTAGQPRVPEPHPADYSATIPAKTLDLIDAHCNQAELSAGKPLQHLDW